MAEVEVLLGVAFQTQTKQRRAPVGDGGDKPVVVLLTLHEPDEPRNPFAGQLVADKQGC